jgi:hypothetical protein
MVTSKRLKVKSEAADAHERTKDYLDPCGPSLPST